MIIKTCPHQGANNCLKKESKKVKKKPIKDLPAYKPESRNFFQDVYDVARQIPKGRVTSYGAIASYLGAASSSRMVGWAMSSSHQCKPKVPAQRVVNRNGHLTGKLHFATPTQMEELLKKEGVMVKDDAVVNFKEIFWDPAKELE